MPAPVRTLPESGWSCERIDDALKLRESARCWFCLRKLRWVHQLTHPECDRPYPAGCCCAARLADGYNALVAENAMKNRYSREARFLSSQWKKSANGNSTRMYGQTRVTVFKNRRGQWQIVVKRRGQPVEWPRVYCASEAEAKAKAFLWLEQQGKPRTYRGAMLR